jgi:hypothetical protein
VVDLVQRVVLCMMGIESCLAGGHRNSVSEWQTEKDLEMENTVHGATCMLERLLERVHRTGDMLLEGIGYENMIVTGIAVIGACAGEVIDPFVNVIGASIGRPLSTRYAHR